MAHNIQIWNGEASMFYVGDPPWHGLGTPLARPATAQQAIRAAKLDWSVKKVPLFAFEGRIALDVPGKFAVVREDLWGTPDCCVLGVVGRDYRPLQNRDAFRFFDPIVGEDAAIYHTAGVLGAGERIWILAKLPSQIRVVGVDISDKYLLLSNSHDGQSAVQMKFTPIRVVCQNTLTMALSTGPTVRAPHLRNLEERLQEARRLLGIVEQRYAEIEKAFQAMAKVQVDGERLAFYLGLVFPDPKDPLNERAMARVKRDRFWSGHFFEHGAGKDVPGVRGTLWAAYNGVTEYIDHRELPRGAPWRLHSVWFGNGYQIKARAFQAAEQQLGAWAN
ncbi:MAG: DUF932 domain-containing protein [Planctomycetes bacterium]|nr:DUF932 domain-containing protein [Planctomycetota bacterium]